MRIYCSPWIRFSTINPYQCDTDWISGSFVARRGVPPWRAKRKEMKWTFPPVFLWERVYLLCVWCVKIVLLPTLIGIKAPKWNFVVLHGFTLIGKCRSVSAAKSHETTQYGPSISLALAVPCLWIHIEVSLMAYDRFAERISSNLIKEPQIDWKGPRIDPNGHQW